MITLAEIAHRFNGTIDVQYNTVEIDSISSLENATPHSISFLAKDAHTEKALKSSCAAVLVKKGVVLEGKVTCQVDDPYVVYAHLSQFFESKEPPFNTGIHPTAVIDPTAALHPSVIVGPFCVIGKNVTIDENTLLSAHCVVENSVRIGSHCRIDPHVTIRRECILGNSVIVQAGAVIGSEGFGNAMDRGNWIRIACFGNVIIEDNVEIGANCTIDRGNFEPTVIRKGVRIDNLVQIAHNVIVGEHTALAAQFGVAGSTVIGKYVIGAGQAGLVGHIKIGDQAIIGAQAGVTKDVEPGTFVTGAPAREMMKVRRSDAIIQNLPQMVKDIKHLQKSVENIEKSLSEKNV